MEETTYRNWSLLSLANLCMVALLGALMRYKIAFSFPILDHRQTMHGHSHFAFSGWVSLAIFIAFVFYLFPKSPSYDKVYKLQFWLFLLSAFGMLLSFPFQGYGPVSIAFSTLSILVSFWFSISIFKDIKGKLFTDLSVLTGVFALIFYVLSAAGPVMLSYLMIAKQAGTNWYLASVYLYLHFNYNGWFLFGILALFINQLERMGIDFNQRRVKTAVILLAISCIPAFFLSVLWMQPPLLIRVIAIAADILQFVAFLQLMVSFKIITRNAKLFMRPVRWLWGLSATALSIKFLLQLLSAIPSLEKYAFAYRPIVIGYIHLVLLGFVTLFLIGFFIQSGAFKVEKRWPLIGLILFVFGVLLNEILLMIQGILSISYQHVHWANPTLFVVSLIMLSGLLLLVDGQRQGDSRAQEK
jgi:hypothetical protein